MGRKQPFQTIDIAAIQFPIWLSIDRGNALCFTSDQIRDIDREFLKLDKLQELYLSSTDALLTADKALKAQEEYSLSLAQLMKSERKAFRKKRRRSLIMGIGSGLTAGIVSGLLLK